MDTGSDHVPALGCAVRPKVQRAEWAGLLAGARQRDAEIQLRATLAQSGVGGSGAFLALADDGRRYWVKPLNNIQGDRVPITEQIVGRIGRLIAAPTCEIRTVGISEDFVGWEFRPGRRLEQGIAHASLHVEESIETRNLNHFLDDDNARRYAYFAAMYDWCWGGDAQGLMAAKDENRFYSHDHGWYLPPEGATWTVDALEAQIENAHELALVEENVGARTGAEVATALDSIQRGDIQRALSMIPASWPVRDDELECVGFFLESRAPMVAERIRRRFRR